MSINVQIIFYSMFGHIYRMVESVAKGAKQIEECNVSLYRVPELVPEEILEKSGSAEYQGKHVAEIANALVKGRSQK